MLSPKDNEHYELLWKDAYGNVRLPAAYVDGTAISWGQAPDKKLVVSGSIEKKNYVVVSNNEKSFALQYLGVDSRHDIDPKAQFKILATGETVNAGINNVGGGDLPMGGVRFKFRPATAAEQDDFAIMMDLDGNGYVTERESAYIRDAGGKHIEFLGLQQLKIGESTINIFSTLGSSIDAQLRNCDNWQASDDPQVAVCRLPNTDLVEITRVPGSPAVIKYKY